MTPSTERKNSAEERSKSGMIMPVSIDEKLLNSIEWPDSLGRIQKSNPLLGMGFGRAFDVEFSECSAIVKVAPHSREQDFYKNLAPFVNKAGISTPSLFHSFKVDDLYGIVIEKIVHQLPESRWRWDEEVLETLGRLHVMPVPENSSSFSRFEWDGDSIEQTLPLYGEFSAPMRSILMQIRSKYRDLFESETFISGDPSGRNWGIRNSGELVLFDWERYGTGAPQIDLAAVAFGQLVPTEFLRLSESYLKFSNLDSDPLQFSKEIQAARVWGIVSMMAFDHVKGLNHLPESALSFFRKEFPEWVIGLESILL